MPRKYSKEEKEEYLKRYYESKQSKLNFAKINGIPKTTFFSWFKNYNKVTNNIEFGKINLKEQINEEPVDTIKIIYNKIEILISKNVNKEDLYNVMEVVKNINDK